MFAHDGEAWEQVAADFEAFATTLRALPVSVPTTPAELKAMVEAHFPLGRPSPLRSVLARTAALLRTGTGPVTHPRYLGLRDATVREAALCEDVLAAVYTPQLAVWSHARAAEEMERHLLRRLASAMGWDVPALAASFTTGGAEANLAAVLLALAHRCPGMGVEGVAALERRPAIYVTTETRHAFAKAARTTGLGTACLREVPVTRALVIDADALRGLLAEDRREGRQPLLIVGTAGTTSAGVIDPLDALADVAAEAGAWLHVDGARGAAAVLSDRLRPQLRGIERADSVAWGANEWLSVPMDAGMFFCRHPETAARVFGTDTSDPADDPDDATAQWAVRAIGLKVFTAVAELGARGYATMIEQQVELGDRIREVLAERGWTIVNGTALPVICFTHSDIRRGRATIGSVLRAIRASARVWLSDVVLPDGERVLRARVTSFASDAVDVARLVDELDAARTARLPQTAGA